MALAVIAFSIVIAFATPVLVDGRSVRLDPPHAIKVETAIVTMKCVAKYV